MNLKSRNFYFSPDGAPGGSATEPKDAKQQEPDDPFKKIDLENLDDESKKAVETAKTQFATLQTERQQAQQLNRQFQSEKDKAIAELNRVRSAIQDPARQAPVDPEKAFTAQVEQLMVESGVSAEAAKAQSPVMAKLLKAQRDSIMTEVGRGLQPMVGSVFTQHAENAYNTIRATDQLGAFAIPEVAQAIWQSCQQIAAEGTQVTPETVKNLKAMHYMNHMEKNGGNFATMQNNRLTQTPPVMNTGGFSYPGANFNPTLPAVSDPNAARTALDPGTKAALQSVFSIMKPGHQIK